MSGWTCRAPNEITGKGLATSTTSRAAVAQPVDWASMPRIAVSYRPTCAVAGADPEDDLLRRDRVTVIERFDPGLGEVGIGQDVAEKVLRLVDPAQDRVLAGEQLHRDDRIETLLLEDRRRPREIDVGRIAGQDFARRSGSDETHQALSLTCRLLQRVPGRPVDLRSAPAAVGRRV